MLLKNALLYGGCVASTWIVAPGAAVAQTQAGRVEEIIVTARRTEENLQTTPVAVTAISAAGLERAQINDVVAVQRAAPNLTITSGTPAASGFAIISMRGQANLNAGNASDPAVGIYVDGVYIARPAGALFDLVDMERVEALRGPQGTLFGRNTIGGALNMVTAQPTGDLSFLGRATVGNYDTKEFMGVGNVPLSGDELAVRVAYQYRDHDGYARNLSDGSRFNDKRDDHFVRAHLRYAPEGGNWDVTLSADYNKSHDNGQLTVLTGANPLVFGPALAQQLEANYGHSKEHWWEGYATSDTATSPRYQPNDSVEGYGFSLHLNADFDWARFKSITAWRKLDSLGYVDLDGTPLSVLEPWNRYYSKGFSQELQLSGDLGKLSWIGGLFYFTEKGTETSEARAFGFLGAPWFANLADVENASYAAYAQLYYQLSDRLRVAAGIRYTLDDRKVVIHNVNPLYPPVCSIPPEDRNDGVSCNQYQAANFDYPAYTLGLDFQWTDNIFAYAKTSGAYMAGGFNLRQGSLPAFKPEGVKDIEFGIKADWFDKRLRTNIAVFHSWQSDVQRNISTVIDRTSTQYIRNAGDAQVTGLELEATAIPWEGMEITGNLGLLDAHYDNGTFTDVQTIAGIPGCGGGEPIGTYNCTVDRSDEKLPQVPKITYSIGLTQTVPMSFGELRLHADYAYVGRQSFAENTAADAQPDAVKEAYAIMNRLTSVRGYGLLNARATIALENPNLELSIWGRNLTQEKYYSRSFADLYTTLGPAVSFVGDPRTYGVTATVRFGP